MNQYSMFFGDRLAFIHPKSGPQKPGEVPSPKKNPEIIPPGPSPVTWPKKEPEVQPGREPLTMPPAAPPEVPKPSEDDSGILHF